MATNFYVDQYQNRSEQNLIESLTIEAIKFYGVDVIYMPRETLERDKILGEDIKTLFDDNYMIEMYLETIDGFEGDGDMLEKFGLHIKDKATFIVSKSRFEEVVYNQVRPFEGDLIFFPLSNRIFEINYVEHENPFYQLGKNYVYKLTVELFEYSFEDFDTDVPIIDSVVEEEDDDLQVAKADNIEIAEEGQEVLVNESEKTFSDESPFGNY